MRRLALCHAIDQGPNMELATIIVVQSPSSDIDSTKEYEYWEDLDSDETDWKWIRLISTCITKPTPVETVI